jgi:hypothetical protein
MVEGPNEAFICADCVSLANKIVEASRAQSPAVDLTDETARRGAHMLIVCFFRLKTLSDTQWTATAELTNEFVGQGINPSNAVRDLQAKLLSSTAESLAKSETIGAYFSNHAQLLRSDNPRH